MECALIICTVVVSWLAFIARKPGASRKSKSLALASAILLGTLLIVKTAQGMGDPDAALRKWEPLYTACQYEVLASELKADGIKELIIIDTQLNDCLPPDSTGRSKDCSRSQFIADIVTSQGIRCRICRPHLSSDGNFNGEDLAELLADQAPGAILVCGYLDKAAPEEIGERKLYACDTDAAAMATLVRAGLVSAWTGFKTTPCFDARRAPKDARAAFDLRYQFTRPVVATH